MSVFPLTKIYSPSKSFKQQIGSHCKPPVHREKRKKYRCERHLFWVLEIIESIPQNILTRWESQQIPVERQLAWHLYLKVIFLFFSLHKNDIECLYKYCLFVQLIYYKYSKEFKKADSHRHYLCAAFLSLIL